MQNKHPLGIRSEKSFYRKDNKPYELHGQLENGDYVMRELFDNGHYLVVQKSDFSSFESITQYQVFLCINNDDDKEHADMMNRLGIGYICPFCGGHMVWEADFMTSDVNGLEHCYVKIEDENMIEDVKTQEEVYIRGNILSVCNDIDVLNKKFYKTGDYPTIYVREDKEVDGTIETSYYVADDPVIGIYHCTNCGKRYEVHDCYISDEDDYPYFKED